RPEYIPLNIRSTAFQLFNTYLGLTLLSYLGHCCNKRWLLISAYILAAGMVSVGVIQGMLTSMLGPIVVLFLTSWAWGKGLEFRWILIAILAIVIISPVKGQFRSLAWKEKDVASLSDAQARLEKWSIAFDRVWNDGVYGVISFLFAYGVILGLLFGNNGKSEQLSMLISIVYIAPQIFILQALALTVASLFSFMVGVTISLWGLSGVSRLRI